MEALHQVIPLPLPPPCPRCRRDVIIFGCGCKNTIEQEYVHDKICEDCFPNSHEHPPDKPPGPHLPTTRPVVVVSRSTMICNERECGPFRQRAQSVLRYGDRVECKQCVIDIDVYDCACTTDSERRPRCALCNHRDGATRPHVEFNQIRGYCGQCIYYQCPTCEIHVEDSTACGHTREFLSDGADECGSCTRWTPNTLRTIPKRTRCQVDEECMLCESQRLLRPPGYGNRVRSPSGVREESHQQRAFPPSPRPLSPSRPASPYGAQSPRMNYSYGAGLPDLGPREPQQNLPGQHGNHQHAPSRMYYQSPQQPQYTQPRQPQVRFEPQPPQQHRYDPSSPLQHHYTPQSPQQQYAQTQPPQHHFGPRPPRTPRQPQQQQYEQYHQPPPPVISSTPTNVPMHHKVSEVHHPQGGYHSHRSSKRGTR